ncbi:MAG: hypothetical protein ACK5Y2_05315 [Bdellovibrionales bacterium]
MKREGLRLGYHLTFEKGSTFKPLSFHFWKEAKDFEKTPPASPSQYMSDLLLGVSFLKLNSYCASPLAVPFVNYDFASLIWNEFEPHRELFRKSQKRVEALHQEVKACDPELVKKFEHDFSNCLESIQKPWGYDFRDMSELVALIEKFESQLRLPLIYDFSLKFSQGFLDKLLHLDSFLFHLRSVVALDHNAHVKEPAFECVKVDSVLDYIPRADYVVSDAMLYHQFKKWSAPFSMGPKSDVRVEKLFVEPMSKAFQKHVHNACYLIDHLPPSFLNRLGPEDLEEALYLVQMDWLMGASTGLLFKVREEIYGLEHGYEHVFWHEYQDRDWNPPKSLKIACELSESAFRKKVA